MVHDLLYTGNLRSLRVGFTYCVTTELVNEVVLRHNCDPLSAHVLGRAVSAGVLLAGTLAAGQRVNLRWAYDGHLRTVLVDAGADGTARGLVSPTNLTDYSDTLDDLFGDKSEVRVIRTSGGQVQNSGTTDSILRDVVNDLSYFLCISDQVETVMTVLIAFNPDDRNPVRLCRGLMLQAMPDTNLAAFDQLRARLECSEARGLLAHETEPDGLLENIIHTLLDNGPGQADLEYVAAPPPRFHCTCNRGKMGSVLLALSRQDRDEIISAGEDVKVHCQFCNECYVLTVDECMTIWGESG